MFVCALYASNNVVELILKPYPLHCLLQGLNAELRFVQFQIHLAWKLSTELVEDRVIHTAELTVGKPDVATGCTGIFY